MTKNSGFAIFSRATDFLFKKRHVNVDGVSETSFTEYWEKGNYGSFLTEHVGQHLIVFVSVWKKGEVIL